jgi:hypothetical protein
VNDRGAVAPQLDRHRLGAGVRVKGDAGGDDRIEVERLEFLSRHDALGVDVEALETVDDVPRADDPAGEIGVELPGGLHGLDGDERVQARDAGGVGAVAERGEVGVGPDVVEQSQARIAERGLLGVGQRLVEVHEHSLLDPAGDEPGERALQRGLGLALGSGPGAGLPLNLRLGLTRHACRQTSEQDHHTGSQRQRREPTGP